MDKLSQAYNNRTLGLVSVTIILVIEHMQAMSYLKIALDPDAGRWSDSAFDLFDFLNDLSLKERGSSFVVLFVLYTLIIIGFLLVYTLFNAKFHEYNASRETVKSMPICLMDYIIFTFAYVPMIYAYSEVQYCTQETEVLPNDDLECFEQSHMVYIQIGLVMLSIVVFLAAAIMPVLKNERAGVERKWGNENYFSAIYKIQIAGLAVLICPVQVPELGIALSAAIIAYLTVFEAYTELHIANVKMGLLFGQLWLFVCAKVCEADTDTGSVLLTLWVPFILLGYSVLHVKHRFFKRQFKEIPIEK